LRTERKQRAMNIAHQVMLQHVLVPAQERDEWSRTWQAELWYMHQRSQHRHVSPLTGIADLSVGLTRDALWLRTEDWRLAFSDTAALCLVSLFGLSLLSTLVALALAGGWHSLHLYLRDELMRSLIAAPRYRARWKPRPLDFRDAISS